MHRKQKIRYAVVGLGYIAQAAVLPAFAHAAQNSELVALVSGDELKLKKLGRKYAVPHTCAYAQCVCAMARWTQFTSLYPTPCIATIPNERRGPACMCFAKSPWQQQRQIAPR